MSIQIVLSYSTETVTEFYSFPKDKNYSNFVSPKRKKLKKWVKTFMFQKFSEKITFEFDLIDKNEKIKLLNSKTIKNLKKIQKIMRKLNKHKKKHTHTESKSFVWKLCVLRAENVGYTHDM